MTTMYMYDDVSVDLIPSSATAVAGYTDGLYSNLTALRAHCPHADILDITVTASEDATCLDIETGDATNAQAATWAKRQIARGIKPVLYTSAGNAQALIDECNAGGVVRGDYLLWAAHYTNVAHICGSDGYPAADGTQYTDTAMGESLDESLINTDFFAGATSTPLLTEGMISPAVGTAQKYLNAWRVKAGAKYAELTVDDDFGPDTLAAVKDFQTFMKLTDDGEIGSQTWAALEKNPDAMGTPAGLSQTAYYTFADFAWDAVDGAASYDFQVVQGTTQVYRADIKGTHAEKIPLNPGVEYYWRVAAIPGGSWTADQKFTTPTNAYPAPKSISVSPWFDATVSWDAVVVNGKTITSYTLEILNSKGQKFAEKVVTGTSYVINIPKGEYTILVWANNSPVAPPHASIALTI